MASSGQGSPKVLKAGIINDPALFERLAGDGGRTTNDERPATSELVGMIADAVREQVCIVRARPYEMGDRGRGSNLGHAFGHAVREPLSSYTLRHGDAVALGMICAAEMSATLGLPRRVLLLRGAQPPSNGWVCLTRHPFDLAVALAAMGEMGQKKAPRPSLRF